MKHIKRSVVMQITGAVSQEYKNTKTDCAENNCSAKQSSVEMYRRIGGQSQPASLILRQSKINRPNY